MKKKNRIIDILIVVFRRIMCFSGYKLYKDAKDARESREQFEQLENIMNRQVERDKPTPLTAGEKYASVYEANNHFIGWITIEGTQMNYPVMQTKDNPEYYLRRDFTKKYNYHGVPFMDYRCTADESDNIIIYAHNMKDGSMFSAVEDYMSRDFYNEHKYVKFDTMNGYGLYEVVFVFKIDVQNNDFRYYEVVDFANIEEFDSFINNAKALAPYDTGVSAEYGDKLLTLSTCEYTLEDGRCVLIAKKIADIETKYFDADGNEVMQE
ncbi:MAG: class B sortase [Oscillospiraceae bacterium]|nr:class B sortase [Oscillospiraceae bacterium]